MARIREVGCVRNVDPITLEVVRGWLVSTVLQMRVTLVRTAYAPILYESRDFSCGLLTPRGELAAMAEDFSGHVFAMALGLNAAQDKFGDDIHPGDVLAVNDPYTGGTHLNDIAFYTPFFVDGRILLYIGVRAHHADVGGATPGSFSGQDTEIYQEGMRIVPVKLVDRGVVNQGLWDVLFANMRLSEERQGDALAMLDTARVAEVSLRNLCDKYGTETVTECMKVQMDSAHESIGRRIAELPDGDYHYEHYMDNGGLSPEPLPIKVKLTIAGDRMTFDFTGTTPQVYGPMNAGIPVTRGAIFVVVKAWLDPKTPVNGGTFRSLDFVIPKGSCLAAELPAAVGGCWDVFRQLQTVVVGLFSQIIPGDLGAENMGGVHHIYVAGYDSQRSQPYILYDYPQGGTPATSDTDGATGSFFYDNGDIIAVQPTESIEQRQPLFIESLAASTDAEGPGYRRSGFGVTRRVRVLSETGQLNVMTERAIIPPWGSAGASSGTCNAVNVVRDGLEIVPTPLPGKVKSFPLHDGDVVLIKATAGGGAGDPLKREVELVRKDVFDGYITARHAGEAYGVVIEDGQVDEKRTRELRDEIGSRRCYFRIAESQSDDYDERGCRLCRLGRGAADRLGVEDGDMVEYVSRTTAPVRAWARVTDTAGDDAAPLGPIGRSMLKLSEGDEIWIRPVLLVTAEQPQT